MENKKVLVPLIIVAVLLAVGAVVYYFSQASASTNAAQNLASQQFCAGYTG